MKLSTLTNACLIVGMLLIIGLSAWPVSASDDNSWLSPGISFPVNDSWLSPGITLPVNDNWLNPDSQEQILAWEAMNAEQNAVLVKPQPTSAVPVTTLTPLTLTRADLNRLLGQYKYGTNGSVNTVIPATLAPTASVAPSSVPTSDDLHTSDGTSVSLLMSQAMKGYLANPQLPITTPVTPVYTTTPSPAITIVPTSTPTNPSGGSQDRATGVSLSGFDLQNKIVTISNTGTTPVVMTGWKISNSQGNSLTFIDFPLGDGSTFTYVLNPFSTLTVYFGKDGAITSTALYYPAGINFWNALGDTASLYNPQGHLAGSITE